MDVLVLIDKLDELVHGAKRVPLTDQVRVNREKLYVVAIRHSLAGARRHERQHAEAHRRRPIAAWLTSWPRDH
jgi:hypothetical protein